MGILRVANSDWYVKPRPAVHNPLFNGCRKHLKRLCGNCAHFSGPVIDSVGDCAKYSGLHDGETSANRCEDWARKSAEGQA